MGWTPIGGGGGGGGTAVSFGGGSELTTLEGFLVHAFWPRTTDTDKVTGPDVRPGAFIDVDSGTGTTFGTAALYAEHEGSFELTAGGSEEVVGRFARGGPKTTEDFVFVFFYERGATSVAATTGGIGWADSGLSTGRVLIRYNHTTKVMEILEVNTTVADWAVDTDFDTEFPTGTPAMLDFFRIGSHWESGKNGAQKATETLSPTADASDRELVVTNPITGLWGPIYIFKPVGMSAADVRTALADLYNSGAPRVLAIR